METTSEISNRFSILPSEVAGSGYAFYNSECWILFLYVVKILSTDLRIWLGIGGRTLYLTCKLFTVDW